MLGIQLDEAKEAVSSAEFTLQRLLAGSREEDVAVARSGVQSAEDTLLSAERALVDAENSADQTIATAYKDVPSLITSTYMDLRVTLDTADDFIDTYFTGFLNLDAIKGRSGRDNIRFALQDIEDYRNIIEDSSSYELKDEALLKIQDAMQRTLSGLDDILDTADSDFYEDKVLSTDVDIIRARRTETVADLNSISSLIQTISAARTSVDAGLNTARASVSSAENALEIAIKELQRVTAPASEEDIEIQRSAVRRAQASVDILTERINDFSLRSPFSGRVAQVFGKVGEVVSPGVPFVTLNSDDQFYIQTYVYERDIVKVNIGDYVLVELVPFPDNEIDGEIYFINETGTLINDVVYYEVKISMEEIPSRTMSEMTADIIITSESKDDVLVVPERFLSRKEGQRVANVLIEGETEERIVETGVRGSGGMIEIVSGLKEGDVITI